jgi:hypothetical protein
MMGYYITGLVVISFILGVGFLIGHFTGIKNGREKGIAEEAARWKSRGEWNIKSAEKHT